MKTFADIVCNQCSLGVDCEHATWFCCNDEDYDDLAAKAKSDPERYREHHEAGISWGTFEGMQVVYCCPVCSERMHRVEMWLKENELIVRQFLKVMGEERLAEAARLASM